MNTLQDIQSVTLVSLTSGEVIRNLVVALICGILISWFYSCSTKRLGCSRTYVASLISLSMITAIVIMVIGNNLARAFGLVGAMSIIRFRTAVKDVQDIVFIFFSLAIGMAAGIGQFMVAITGTLAVGLIMVAIARIQSFGHKKQEYIFQFTYSPTSEGEAPYLLLFKKYCKRHTALKIKSYDDKDLLELTFYVQLKNPDQKHNMVRELKQIKGIRDVNLFFNEENP